MTLLLPPLPDRWESTRQTLHEHALRLRALARAFAPPHPRFWNVGLTIGDDGLRTAPMPLAGGGEWTGRLDLQRHVLLIEATGSERAAIDLRTRSSGAALTRRLTHVLADLGIDAAGILEDDGRGEASEYDPATASAFWHILGDVAEVFESRRRALAGDVGPIHVWPHGFDASFEWYPPPGTGQPEAQLNVGFSPAQPAYFYSNPHPFDPALRDAVLPHGARWHTEDWEGSMLAYDLLVGATDAEYRLLEYMEAVAAAAVPTLANRSTTEEVAQ